MIDKDEGRDTVKEQETQFKQTGSLTDLIALADELRRKEEWEALCKYGEILFERTRSVHDAEGLVLALYNAKKFSRIVELVEADAEFIEQSASLHIFYCSSLYYEGELLRARDELAQLSTLSEDVHYRALRTNIAIAIGDWDSLSEFVREEHLQIENRSARELIEAAQLSLYLSLQNTRDLLFAAAEKGIDDADILITAYFLATKAGWENDSKIITWLHRASELSGDEGPIWRVTANDFLNMRPDWIRLGSEIRHQLNLGEIPMILVAEFFKRPLANQMLFPAYENLPKRDPRRMSCIPAYSGGRQPNKLDTGATVGMDYTTLLTLSFLNLLNTVLDAFDTIYVPHSTLAWLFEEKQQVAFHQPSRIANAQYIRDLLAKGFLEEFPPTTTTDRGLAAEVGDGLAMFIAEAESNTDGDMKRLVVRSSPVHRIGSLLEEEVDLGEHAAVVSSCQAIVRTLRHKGQISSSDEQRALAYLQLKEKPWPNQPEISGELTLYLDDLAVAYFLHLGMLEALSAAGFRVNVSPSMIFEVDELIAYERISGLVNSAIDNIRSVVSQGIASEKIKVGKWRYFDEWEEEIKSDLHIANVLVLAEDCEGIIVDDRYLNQHPRIEYNGAQRPLFSTLDLLDALVSADLIADFDRLEYRTKLRQAGYIFVPITEDELTHHLRTATVTDGRLNETLELKAIRENTLLVRMGVWLQLPKEDLWLETMTKVSVNVLRNLWEAGADISGAEARSNWILDQIDVRGWVHCFSPESRNDIVKTGRVGVIFMLLTSLDADVPLNIREAYWRWVEDSLLKPVKEQFPDLYALIVNIKRRLIGELADTNLPDEEQSEK